VCLVGGAHLSWLRSTETESMPLERDWHRVKQFDWNVSCSGPWLYNDSMRSTGRLNGKLLKFSRSGGSIPSPARPIMEAL